MEDLSNNPFFKKLKEENPDAEGYIWVNILIRYGLDGKSEVVKSFCKPAIQSQIKGLIKPKIDKSREVIRKEAVEEENLFG